MEFSKQNARVKTDCSYTAHQTRKYLGEGGKQAQNKARREVVSWLQSVKSRCNVQSLGDDYGKDQKRIKAAEDTSFKGRWKQQG